MMIRNFKVLGLALVALFAMSAVVASAALAQQGKFTSDGPATGDGIETGAGANFFEMFGQKIECPGSTFDVEKVGGGLVESGATTFTVTPAYNNATCNVKGIKMTVNMNGCDFVFHIGETTEIGVKENTYGVTADLVCPGVIKSAEMTIFASATSEAVTTCRITIPEQAGLKGGHITGTPKASPEDIDVEGVFTGIKAVQDKVGACAAKEEMAAKYTVDITITGTNSTGGATGITVTD